MQTVDATLEREASLVRDAKEYSIVDCDVHPLATDGLNSVYPYMSRAWRRRFSEKGATVQSPLNVRFSHPTGAIRPDATTPSGRTGGSEPEFMREDLLERFGIAYAILSGLEPARFAVGLAGPDESTSLCSAFNDYFIEEWLSVDKRFRYVICVSPQDPEKAAQEVRRHANTRGVVGVYLPPMNILMGNRHHYPIYKAAQRAGLPIFFHVTGAEIIYQGAPVASGGWPESYAERRMAFYQVGEANLASLVFTGVFERFPELKFVFAESGFTWAVPHSWRMDATWQMFRAETPWVKRPPSEYIRERVGFTTQPLEGPIGDSAGLNKIIEMLGEETLLFATDYPHFDQDNPDWILRGLSAETKAKIFSRNAHRFFRLD
ncbi:MAG TPA: amidohydrolase family protein [Candidatus Saccharimonadales bacterium]|nr:amidohydrolase family protein [Candidatus Saccharimonadales bacterium]